MKKFQRLFCVGILLLLGSFAGAANAQIIERPVDPAVHNVQPPLTNFPSTSLTSSFSTSSAPAPLPLNSSLPGNSALNGSSGGSGTSTAKKRKKTKKINSTYSGQTITITPTVHHGTHQHPHPHHEETPTN